MGVQRVDFLMPEARLVDLEIGPQHRRRRNLLNREAHGFSRRAETPVAHLRAAVLAAAREQFRGRIEIEAGEIPRGLLRRLRRG